MDDYKIYPKQFRNSKIPIEKNRCFFLMPFKNEYNHIYGTLKECLQNNGYIVNRADEIAGSKPIMNKILNEILRSQYIVVDLTGYNPNVFYELGVSHSFKDAQNILLIKQKDDKIPFDISHLTYIEYDPNNLFLLTSRILTFINENKYLNDFYEILNVHGIIKYIDSNTEDFVDYIRESLGDKVFVLIDILNRNYNETTDFVLEQFLKEYLSIIAKIIHDRNCEVLPGTLCIYKEILLCSPSTTMVENYVFNFIYNFFEQFDINDNEVLGWKTDFIIGLAMKEKFLNICMPWIIEYFSKSKSATIDLNRYKIENFLMLTSSSEINTALINSLNNQDCHIREHIADIIGEKRLYQARNQLYFQLLHEKNFYSANSMISAIGKVGDEKGIEVIENWIESNKSEMMQTKQFFVVKYGLWAIEKLDASTQKMKFTNFKEKYKDCLKDYFIW